MEFSGFRFSTINAGIKGEGRPDMALMVAIPPARWVGMFTTNRVKAAPVLLGMERLERGALLSAILVNSGNANACNGPQGMADAIALCRETARLLEVPEEQVLLASTGVIGQPLPMEKMVGALPALVSGLGQATLEDVATALMTTDRFPKWAVVDVAGFPGVRLGGVVKGAGMIHPNMATMLGFFFVNAGLPIQSLRVATQKAVEESFNRITVDGDQSTNDTVLVLDNGSLEKDPQKLGNLERAVSEELNSMMRALAWKIVENGEGVTKVVTLLVEGARTPRDARKVAERVGTSPLVKTAFFGEDPNWGRLMAAIGASGARMDSGQIDIDFEGIRLVTGGQQVGEAAERAAAEVMKRPAYTIRIDLHQGTASYRLVTSDLSEEFVRINADYRS